MPDTEDNQKQFPQQKNQRPGAGFPIARACVVLSLATAAVQEINIGPYEGKQTGESALLRGILDCLHPGDVAVFDRIFCSFLMLALLRMRGMHFCARLHQRRPVDFRKGRPLGPDDRRVPWIRPKRPAWMLPATGACRDERELWKSALKRIAANEVANRPGRIEPRMIKRNRQHYPMMHDPRRELQKRCCMT